MLGMTMAQKVNGRMSDKIIVDLGSGRQWSEVPDHIHIDILPGEHIECEWDLERGLPKMSWDRTTDGTLQARDRYKIFSDNSVDEFRAHHCLEHIRNLIPLMNEMWSALKPSGVLKVYVPNAECPRAAWGDPTHVRAFSTITFSYFTRDGLVSHPYTDKAWKIFDGYPKVNGTPPNDLWELECYMSPDKE